MLQARILMEWSLYLSGRWSWYVFIDRSLMVRNRYIQFYWDLLRASLMRDLSECRCYMRLLDGECSQGQMCT